MPSSPPLVQSAHLRLLRSDADAAALALVAAEAEYAAAAAAFSGQQQQHGGGELDVAAFQRTLAGAVGGEDGCP